MMTRAESKSAVPPRRHVRASHGTVQALRSREEAATLGEARQMEGVSAGTTHEPRKASAFAGQAKEQLRAQLVSKIRKAAEKALVFLVSGHCWFVVWK